MKRPHLGLMLAGLAVLAAVLGYRLGAPWHGGESTAAPVTPLFKLVLTDLKGQPQALDQWHGKILIVNYWATWCLPCREEMPGFSRLQDKYRDKNVQFVGISIDTVAKIIEFQKITPVSYPLLIGDIDVMENSVALGNTQQALPFTAVVDPQGGLVLTKLGRLAEAVLEQRLIELIEQYPPELPTTTRARGT